MEFKGYGITPPHELPLSDEASFASVVHAPRKFPADEAVEVSRPPGAQRTLKLGFLLRIKKIIHSSFEATKSN